MSRLLNRSLLIDIAEQVEWLDGDIGTADSALQERPEILQAVRVYLAINIRSR